MPWRNNPTTPPTQRLSTRDPQLLRTTIRAIAWARVALALHMLVVNALRYGRAEQPILLAVLSLAIVAWSVGLFVVDTQTEHGTAIEVIGDLFLTLMAVIGSRFILGSELLHESHLGVACWWALVAPMVMVVWRGSWWGIGTGVFIGALQFVQAPGIAARAWSELLISCAVPYLFALLIKQLDLTITERDRNFATAAALEERERLNRILHDGVLQVLAMVAREGNELGPRGKMLAVLARKQEDQLRVTLQDRKVDVVHGGFLDPDKTDITTMLEKHQSRTVTVSTMAGEVNMAAARATELDRVITEVLSNVFKHAGVDARAWILLEQEGNDIIITVRDDGVGMTRQQLEDAVAAGRLGVKESIIGRVVDLHGTSTVHSAPGEGTEWELRIPLEW